MNEPIVVGLNGSAGARSALLWAWNFASMSGLDVRVVHAWRPDSVPLAVPTDDREQAAWVDLQRWYDAARRLVDAIPQTSLDAVKGAAGPTLVAVAAANRAPLLAVGTQHHGAGRLVHGSVSHYVLSHAGCPVVAVPPPRAERDLRYPDPSELSLAMPRGPRC
jgi:nucleotide-binding universal stress UspA family protein